MKYTSEEYDAHVEKPNVTSLIPEERRLVEEWEEAKKDPEQKDDFPDCKNDFPKDTIKAAKLIEEWWKEDKEEVEKALKE